LRVRRPQKLLLVIAGTVAATYLLGATLLPLLVNAERLRPQAEAKLQTALGRRVSLGTLRLSLWSGPALLATSLRIGEALSGSSASTVRVEARETAVHVAWLPLLRKHVELRSIDVEDLKITQDEKPLISAGRLRGRMRFAPDGTVAIAGSLDATLAALTAAPDVRAEFTATLGGGTLELAALGATVGPLLRIEAAGRVADVASPSPRLTLSGTAKLKRSQLTGRFDLVVAPQPEASFELGSPLLDVDEIIAAAAPFRASPAPRRAALRIVPEASAAETVPAAGESSLARALVASGTLHADRCVVRGLELTNLSMRASVEHGVAELRDIAFALYGGKAQGSLTVRHLEPQLPFSLEQTAEGISIRSLIAALAPAQAGTVDGSAALAVRLNGDAGGAALLPSMNGVGTVAIVDGKLSSFGLIKQVLAALEVAGAKGISKDETPFDHLSAHFDVVSGTAVTKDLEFRSRDVDGDGTGTVGLGGALHLDLLASFSKAVSDDLVAKTHALSIRQGADGRLSVPLRLRGTIRDPSLQLDLDKVLNDGVLRALKKEGTKSLLKKLLGR
jgi:AsmA protein